MTRFGRSRGDLNGRHTGGPTAVQLASTHALGYRFAWPAPVTDASAVAVAPDRVWRNSS
jgi:hypothetical protein